MNLTATYKFYLLGNAHGIANADIRTKFWLQNIIHIKNNEVT